MQSVTKKILHNKQTTINDGEHVQVVSGNRLVIVVNGTSTSYTIQFYASLDDEIYFPIVGVRTNDPLNYVSSYTANSNDVVAFDFDNISSYQLVKVKLTAISNGYISVFANCVRE